MLEKKGKKGAGNRALLGGKVRAIHGLWEGQGLGGEEEACREKWGLGGRGSSSVGSSGG